MYCEKLTISKTLKIRDENLNKIKNKLLKSKISGENYDSTQMGFFRGDIGSPYQEDSEIIKSLPKGLNRNIQLIYYMLGNDKKEIYLAEWTMMSLQTCLNYYESKCNDGQKDVFDFAFRYLGMGHIEVLSCDLKTHLLFTRYDGGANGYERDDNYQSVIKTNTDEYEKMFFSDWFFKINLDHD